MKSYVYDPNRSYSAYLQQAEVAANGDVELTPRAALLIGSPLSAAEGSAAGAAVALLAAPFHWGRTEQMMTGDVLGASLAELKQKARTPAEMWAYEQFDVARDAFRRELWQEAIVHLNRAIRGDESHGGYELDFRFHFLLGLIRLGNFRHHDPALLDFRQATEAFFAAGRLAKHDHSVIAARAFFAAGWSCYVQGAMGEALAHTNLALALNANLPEIQFQAAKILLHQQQPETARSYLARAVALQPAFAAQAMHDGDFASQIELVFEVVEAERLEVGRKASQILRNVTERAEQLGLFALDEATAEKRGFGSVLKVIEQARVYSREYSLYGYLRAAATAMQANEALITAVVRIEKARHHAEDRLREVEEKIAQVTALEIGAYRLNRISGRELDKVTALLEQAKQAVAKNTLEGSQEAEEIAGRALTTLGQTVDHFRMIALHQASAENAELEREVEAFKNRRGKEGNAVKVCAAIGALLALFPGSYFSFFAVRAVSDARLPEVVLRSVIGIGIFALFGALVGMLFAPMIAPNAAVTDHALEKRLAALKQTIAALREVSLQPHSSAPEQKKSFP